MNCPRCQHENPPDGKFCEECGARLGLSCPGCGASFTEGKKFCRSCGAPLAASPAARAERYASPQQYTPKHLAERILLSKEALEGERKQVTVLFADLKGSMELLADRDPEEARALLDPVLDKMIEAVHRYEGTVNQVMGDGIMALFGAPLALEDHAVRACYAALAMQSAIHGYGEELRRSQGVTARIRVGLNSGEVVVRAIGSDLHMDYTAVGQTTHVAARMEQLADPGATLLSAATLQLVEGLVAVKPQGPVPVKGLSEAIEVYELTGAGAARSRLQAAAVRGLTKFVGRSAELTQINHALERAQAGHGQIVALVGEPGVGKSRLVWEFVHSHRLQGWLVLESASVSYGKASAYRPVIDLLKSYFQIEERDEPRRVREKAAGKLLMLDRQLEPLLPALLFLLDTPLEDAQWDQIDPAQKRLRILEACKRLILRESRVQPILLVFEDLHWIDHETQAFLDGLVESLPTARVLLLVNYRPEYQQRWGAKTYYLQMRIDPLAGESAATLLDTLLGEDASLAPLKPLLIQRTEGNPLFLEESVRTMVETGQLLGSRGAYRLTAPVTSVQVPATVQAILAARIDRLSPEDKRLLQAAAVVGKDVPYALLQAIVEMPEERLHQGLAELQAAEFLYEASLFPDLEYTFKHALTHEVAYGSVLQERRRTLHGRILQAIERLYAGRIVEQVEPLAHHAFRGELWQKASTYLQEAGEKAFSRAAYREHAIALEQAVAAVGHLPETRETLTQTIDLCLLLRIALTPLAEAAKMLTYARAAEGLAVKLTDAERRGWVAMMLSHALDWVGELEAGEEYARQALALGMELDHAGLRVVASHQLAATTFEQGSFGSTVQFLSQVVQPPPTLRSSEAPAGYARTASATIVHASYPLVWLPAVAAFCYAELGDFDAAFAHGNTARHGAAARGYLYEQGFVEIVLGHAHLLKGQLAPALSHFEHCRETALTAGVPALLIWVASGLAAVYNLSRRSQEAIALLDETNSIANSVGYVQSTPTIESNLGEAYALEGRTAEGISTLEHAIELARGQGGRGNEARALFAMGNVHALRSPPAAESAREFYAQAIALARELEMRPLEAQCHLKVGQLAQKAGKNRGARKHLTRAASMFREMGMQFWLEKAEAGLETSP